LSYSGKPYREKNTLYFHFVKEEGNFLAKNNQSGKKSENKSGKKMKKRGVKRRKNNFRNGAEGQGIRRPRNTFPRWPFFI